MWYPCCSSAATGTTTAAGVTATAGPFAEIERHPERERAVQIATLYGLLGALLVGGLLATRHSGMI